LQILPIHGLLKLLALKVFPDYAALTRSEVTSAFHSSRVRLSEPTSERKAEFKIWWTTHSAMPLDEIQRLLADESQKELAKRKARADLDESLRFFNRPSATCDSLHWSRMDYWAVEEAVALSLGKNPKLVEWETIKPFLVVDPNGFTSTLAKEFDERLQVARRAVAMKKLHDPERPSSFIRWAERLKFSFPTQLRDLIAERGPIVDFEDIAAKQSEIIVAQKQTIETLTKTVQTRSATAELHKQAHDQVQDQNMALAAQLAVTKDAVAAASQTIENLNQIRKWPWGDHDTELLQHLAKAAKKWWVRYDASDISTATPSKDVAAWLQAQTTSDRKPIAKRTAEIMAQILRPDGLRTGPK
jgi:hypothetical protein